MAKYCIRIVVYYLPDKNLLFLYGVVPTFLPAIITSAPDGLLLIITIADFEP